jgi:hypothetical protein
VVEKRELRRLVTSALVHIDSTHLISNLAAAVPDCLYLERTQGSAQLALDVAGLTLLSHGLYGGRLLLGRPGWAAAGAAGRRCTAGRNAGFASRRRARGAALLRHECAAPAQPPSRWLLAAALAADSRRTAPAPAPVLPAVGYALFEKALLRDKHTYYSVGAVGFSGVVFALKVVSGARWARATPA